MDASFKAQIQHLLPSLDLFCSYGLCFGNTALAWSCTAAKVCSVSWGIRTLEAGTPKQELLSAPSYSYLWATGRDIFHPFLPDSIGLGTIFTPILGGSRAEYTYSYFFVYLITVIYLVSSKDSNAEHNLFFFGVWGSGSNRLRRISHQQAKKLVCVCILYKTQQKWLPV